MTVRVPARTRRRIEALARKEGRSLSQEVERLLEQAIGEVASGRRRGARSLAGALRGGRAPSLSECGEVRRLLSAALAARGADV